MKDFIHDDEYLYMKNFNDVNDMILYYQDKWEDMNKLSIRWKNMFPENANDERGEKSLLEFCTNSNEKWAKLFDGGNKPIKTFVKTTQKIFYDCWLILAIIFNIVVFPVPGPPVIIKMGFSNAFLIANF